MRGDFPIDRAASPRWLTIPLSKLYDWSQSRFHKSWDKKDPFHAGIPVISIGNLTVGGTGKTPTVMALAKLLTERFPNLKQQNAIAILSRGYGRKSKNFVEVNLDSSWESCGDEPLLIKKKLPHTAVLVFENRVESAKYATARLNSKVILIDDGFQHRQLFRDINLVLLDSVHPFGNNKLLPAGPLREQPSALSRASALILNGESSEKFPVTKPILQTRGITSLPKEIAPGSKVFVLTAIARPERFVNLLANLGVQYIGGRHFMDHHPFTMSDLEETSALAEASGADFILTTEKDRVRIQHWNHRIRLVSAEYHIEFTEVEQLLEILSPVTKALRN